MGRWFGGTRGLYEHCGWCEEPILYGEEPVAVTPNTEKAEASGVEVRQSDVMLVLCSSCGGRLDADSRRRDLRDRRRGM